MSEYQFTNWYDGRRVKKVETVPFTLCEALREEFKLNKTEMAGLLGVSDKHYWRAKYEGKVTAFRYYAARDALNTWIFEQVKELVDQSKRIYELK